MANTGEAELNILFLPYFVTSHIIPLVDTARLFARRGVNVTIVTTPANARLFQDSVDRDIAASDSRITVHKLRFPASEVGLPEGVENFGSTDSIPKLGTAIEMLRQPMEELIRRLSPDCIVSDMFFPWTVDIAHELGIPRLMLLASNCFSHSIFRSLKLHAPHHKSDAAERFVVPGLPDEIHMKRSELSDHIIKRTPYGDLIDQLKESETRSYGIIFTTYYELEPAYVDYCTKALGRKCWPIGLPSQFLDKCLMMAPKEPSNDHHSIMHWLGNQKPESVLYVCFGSMIRFPDSQLHELALALEASGCNFIWVVRNKKANWLPEGYEERLKETKKGLIVRHWAPQVAILEHPSTGGFMTHCGWNSTLEGIAAGVPFIAWPLFAEQFYNAKLIAQVLKIGVEVGSEVWNSTYEIKSPVVRKDKIDKAIRYLMMGGSDQVKEIRRRGEEVSLVTKKSQEEGGSALASLDSMIKDIKLQRKCCNTTTNVSVTT